MAPSNIMDKIRQWDNMAARWMLRHFYFIFFEFVLVFIFFILIFNVYRTLDLSGSVSHDNVIEQILFQQTVYTLIITVLMIMNSFWMLYIFNGMNRIRMLLKDISFGLMRSRHKRRDD